MLAIQLNAVNKQKFIVFSIHEVINVNCQISNRQWFCKCIFILPGVVLGNRNVREVKRVFCCACCSNFAPKTPELIFHLYTGMSLSIRQSKLWKCKKSSFCRNEFSTPIILYWDYSNRE